MYKTIMVPLDNSPADRTILAHVRELARLMKSRLILIHVADGHAARNKESLNLDDSEEIRGDREYLETCRSDLAADGFEVRVLLEMGDPVAEILAAAGREQPDLIAMATHGHRFIKDTILGSVASSLRHRTGIPILMIRAAAPS
ncbi:MAG: universal stress protein [Planctomycetes bacterium]|nr:universal stress protein [Planctomycetota bacterium]